MATAHEGPHIDIHPRRPQDPWLPGVAAPLPGIAVRADSPHDGDPPGASVLGSAIVGAAFLRSWAAEAAQAISIIAWVAPLPEHAADLPVAVTGGSPVREPGTDGQEAFHDRCPASPAGIGGG
ncbi:MAG TPA: hypothetical protein VFO65_10830 [Acidimicrobiales bacterium]|nr:hypothetical protein [Acidimicrobiales bacterium]